MATYYSLSPDFPILSKKRIAMNVEEIRKYCISKPGVTEGFPFNKIIIILYYTVNINFRLKYTLLPAQSTPDP